MKTPKLISLLCLLVIQVTLSAQVQWYQNQDANNPVPSGTVATSIQPFTATSFIACYLWSSNNEMNTWKISKTSTSGVEQKTFFISSTSANVEFRVGRDNTVYVFERSFTPVYSPQYILYKLDAGLQLKARKNIEFANGFYIYNTNAFELDNAGNVYFAGDGQFTNTNGSASPASFVLKLNKNLSAGWSKMDSAETSYSYLHIDSRGRVLVVEDYYTFFPQVRIKRFTALGQSLSTFISTTDAARYSLFSMLDEDDNILLYGSKTVSGTAQAMYLKRISRFSGIEMYSKTHFIASSSQLNDLKGDGHGKLFTLVTQYYGTPDQKTKISSINLSNGMIAWTRSLNFKDDSCNLNKLILGRNDRFYAVGERKSCLYFSKGFAARIKKNGQADGYFLSPDSVNFQRSHWLADGMMDSNNGLIAIGNTTDLDTVSFNSTYFRSFAIRVGNNEHCYSRGADEMRGEELSAEKETDDTGITPKLIIYPNPVQNVLTVSAIDPDEFDRITIYNMQGAVLQQQPVRTTWAKMDISYLPDGLYLLVLQSSQTHKEKSIKFVVRK